MRTASAVVLLVGSMALPVGAQRDERSRGVPPGHLPPPGECRVWYDHRPPGHQPPPTSCREAERIAARDRYARVIYGDRPGWHDDGSRRRDDRRRDDDGWWGRDDRDGRENRERPRAVPRRYPSADPYPDRSPYPNGRYPQRFPGDRGGYGHTSVPFDNGYEDGYEKGREDAGDNDAYDPVRHSRYRAGDRGYNRRYGTKEQYKDIYREGFRAGYDDGYRENSAYSRERRRDGIRFPWSF